MVMMMKTCRICRWQLGGCWSASLQAGGCDENDQHHYHQDGDDDHHHQDGDDDHYDDGDDDFGAPC